MDLQCPNKAVTINQSITPALRYTQHSMNHTCGSLELCTTPYAPCPPPRTSHDCLCPFAEVVDLDGCVIGATAELGVRGGETDAPAGTQARADHVTNK